MCVYKGSLFSPITIYTNEWRKRGLPHVHAVSWLKNQIPPTVVDDVFRTELLDANNDPFSIIVKRNMIHGCYNALARNAPCIKN